MSSRILAGLRMTRESRSYIDAMHAVLTHRGWFHQSKAMLAGMTVNGFRFTVDRSLSAESWHAYNWIAEHFLSADFIGIASSQKAGFTFAPTSPLYRKHAVNMIKQAIDSGTGAVFWKDDFVIATGYDDPTGTLLYDDGTDPEGELKELHYDDFGRNETPYWYFQILEACVPLDELEIYKESFMQAIYKWETHDLMLPKSNYACGKQAYHTFINRLDEGNYNPDNVDNLILRYGAAKRDLSAYAAQLAEIWPACKDLAACYAGILELFDQISPGSPDSTAARRIPLFRKALELEDHAVQLMKSLMRERIHNRFGDIALR